MYSLYRDSMRELLNEDVTDMRLVPYQVSRPHPSSIIPGPYAGGVRGGSDEPSFLGLIVPPPEYYSHKQYIALPLRLAGSLGTRRARFTFPRMII